jgi:hypothetical protein
VAVADAGCDGAVAVAVSAGALFDSAVAEGEFVESGMAKSGGGMSDYFSAFARAKSDARLAVRCEPKKHFGAGRTHAGYKTDCVVAGVSSAFYKVLQPARPPLQPPDLLLS